MRKRHAVFLIILIFIFVAAVYTKNVYLPRKLKGVLIAFLDTHSPFKVKFSRLSLGIGGNIHITDVEAKLPDGHIILLLKDVAADISFRDLLRRRIFFDSLKFKGLEVFIRRQNKKIDIEETISQYVAAKKAGVHVSSYKHLSSSLSSSEAGPVIWGNKFFIYRIIVPDSQLHFYDASSGLQQRFNVSAYADLHSPQAADIDISLSSSMLSLKYWGEADFKEKTLKGRGVVDSLDPARFMLLFGIKPKYRIDILKINKWKYSLSLSKSRLVLVNTVDVARLGIRGRQELKSALQAEGDVRYEMKEKKLTFEVRGKLKDGRLSKLPYVGEISHIESEFSLNNSSFRIMSFKGAVYGQPIEAGLLIDSLKNPHIHLIVKSQLDLEVLNKLSFLKLNSKFQGPAVLKAELDGNLGKIRLSDLKAEVILQNGNVDFRRAAFKQIKGQILLKAGGLSWKDVQFLYRNIRLKSCGYIDSLMSIKPVFSLSSDYFDLDASFFWNKDRKIIQNISIKGSAGKGTSFNLQGSLDSASGLFFKVKGIANVNLKDISALIDTNTKKFLSPQGEAEIQFISEGNPKDIKSLRLQASLESKEIKLHSLQFNNLKALAVLEGGQLIVSPLEAGFYRGDLQLRLKYSLVKHNFLANFKLVEADVNQIAVDLGRKVDDYSGKLSLDIDATAFDLKDKDSWRAEGRAEIKDGKIWKLDLFRGIEKLLPLKGRQEIVFRNGWANFSLEKKIINLEGLSLLSTFLEIKSKGTISLTGGLNLLVFLNISPPLIRDAPGLNKIASFLLDNGFVTVEVKGNIKKPAYRLVPFFIKSNPVKKMKDFIEDVFNVFSE